MDSVTVKFVVTDKTAPDPESTVTVYMDMALPPHLGAAGVSSAKCIIQFNPDGAHGQFEVGSEHYATFAAASAS